MRIEGIITLTSPLHCASKTDSNHTHVMRQPVVTPHGTDRVPYFPGNDLKGRLHRKAARVVMEHLKSTGRKLDVPLYIGLTCGDAMGKIEQEFLTIEEVLRARDNPLIGLFGGGCRILRGRLRVNDLIPVLESTVTAGLVPRAYAEETGSDGFLVKVFRKEEEGGKAVSQPARGNDILNRYTFYKVDDAYRVSRLNEVMEYIEDPVVAISSHQAAVLNSQSARKLDASVKKTDASNILTYDAISAGTPMFFRAEFAAGIGPHHIGLFLLALQDLVREQALGGKVAAGLGRFTASLRVVSGEGANPVFTESPVGMDATLTPQMVATYVEPARQVIAGITYEAMADFFTARRSEEERRVRKGRRTEKAA